MNAKTPYLTAVISVAILLFIIFLGYTYYADAKAIEHVYATVETIDQINPKFSKATITFTLNITNPSTRDVNKLSSTFDLYIENNYIGSGSFSNLSIPSQTNKFKQVSMTVEYKGIADSVVDILKNWAGGQNTTMKVDGTMTASILFGLATASHDYIAKPV